MQPHVKADTAKSICKHVQKWSELPGQQTAPVQPKAVAVLVRAGTLRAPAAPSNTGVGLRSPCIAIWFGWVWLASGKLNLPLEKTGIGTELEGSHSETMWYFAAYKSQSLFFSSTSRGLYRQKNKMFTVSCK